MAWIGALTYEGDSFSWERTNEGLKLHEREVHVYPDDDVAYHSLVLTCACSPRVMETGVISHNAFDERELWEELREI